MEEEEVEREKEKERKRERRGKKRITERWIALLTTAAAPAP